MRKSIIILTFTLMIFFRSFGFVDFVCLQYIQDTLTQTYCVTYQDISSCTPNTWSWNFDNGQTANTSFASSCFSYPGIYHVKLVVRCQGGSLDSAMHTLYVDSANILCSWTGSVGVAKNNVNRLHIYPNPVRNILTIKNNLIGTTFEIFSLFGTSLYKQKLNEEDNNINLEFLPCGIYYLRYMEMKEERVIKLIKQ